jgi:Tol biopolymer transport system component
VTAVDKVSNESASSTTVGARVYAPVIAQPYTPTKERTIQLAGSNATANANIEIIVQTASEPESRINVVSDANGNFNCPVDLLGEEIRITAKATDAAGNLSRVSDTVSVIYAPQPTSPTGLAAAVSDYNVHLTWNRNSESNLAGYNLYRDGAKIDMPVTLATGTATASSTYSSYSAAKAFDRNNSTYWMSSYSYQMSTPIWWQLALAAPELINHVEIHWLNLSYAGKNFEIQAWAGYGWVTLTKQTGNTAKDTIIDIKPSYRTDKIRVYITDTTYPDSYYKYAAISEVQILKDNLAGTESSDDLGLKDGRYHYTATAVNYYGFESDPSEQALAEVGDVLAPGAPQNLAALVSGSDVVLTWSANSESDLAGYHVYKNAGQGWVKLTASSITNTSYSDPGLINGTYLYRITALDTVGNGSMPTEIAATVSVELPTPLNLTVSTVPEGKALTVSWQPVTASIVGYNLYRGSTPGGPYIKINSTSVTNSYYPDKGLLNDTAYYYVVCSTDTFGNESPRSNETVGIARDTVPPSTPHIYFPTVPGVPATVYENGMDILGTSEPGADVEIYLNSSIQNVVKAREQDDYQKKSLAGNYYGNGMDISRDGMKIVYSDNSYNIRIIDVGSGTTVNSGQTGRGLKWSPDGKRFLYTSLNYHVYVYDIETMAAIPLTGEAFYESSGSWSPDGRQVAFYTNRHLGYDIWIKNLETGSLQKITNYGGVYPKWSPDGKYIAYKDNFGSTYFIDLESRISTMIDSWGINGAQFEWSPDTSKIVYSKYYALWTFDLKTSQSVLLTSSGVQESMPAWAPDGENVLFQYWDGMLGKYSLGSRNSRTGEKTVITTSGISYPYNVLWSRSGRIAYSEANAVNLIDMKGQFKLSNILLTPGVNIITAVAKDESGNSNSPSQSITVLYDTSMMPDAEVAGADIYLYPPYPVAGEQMAINIAVWNKGQTAANAVDVDVYMWNANGQLEVLASKTVPSIAAQSAELVGAIWDSAGKTGQNRLVVVIDASDTITELDEANNMAVKDFIVSDNAGITITVSTDASQYGSNQNVVGDITLWNNGDRKDVTLNAHIEDDNGYPITTFDPINTSIDYGQQQSYPFTWNTASTFAGSYRLRSVLTDTSGVLSENTVTFTIIRDSNLDLTVSTDKLAYGSNENVVTSFRIRNAGTNYIIPAIQSTVTITNATGTVLFSDAKTITDLLPGSSVDLRSSWNTGLMAPGNYYATVTVSSDGMPTTMKSVSFTINSLPVLTGAITVSPSVFGVGNTAQVSYTLANSGNADALGYAARISVIDPETQVIMQSQDQGVDIAQNSNKSGQVTVDTAGYELKTYTALLQLVSQDTSKNIAAASFTVKDLTPPVVTVVSPQTDGTYNSVVILSALAVDNSSGVGKVEYQIDSGQWYLLPPADPTQRRYTTTWNAAMTDNGSHIVSFRATDRAGNASTPVPVTFVVQTDTTPPVIVLSTLPDGAYTNNATLNVAGTATDNIAVQTVTVNEINVPLNADGTFSQIITLMAGTNPVTTVATDRAENSTTDTRTITLDQTKPAITVTSPADNSVTNIADAAVTGTVDKTSTVTVNINNEGPVYADMTGNSFSLPVGLSYGLNTIEVTATDLATNSSTAKRTVIFDAVSPSVSITSPAEDMTTNQPSVLLQGSVADLTGTTVTITLDGTDSTPSLTNGIFEQTLSFAAEKQYSIFVTATDAAGNKTTVQRNIIYKKTATNFTYTGTTLITFGRGAVLSAVMKSEDTAHSDLSGKEVTFTLGSGSGGQSCTGTTDAGGNAGCIISPVTVPIGPATVTMNFAGDSFYNPSTDSESVIIFAFLDHGSFVIGDQAAAVNTTVTFWDAQWSNANAMSSGPAPTSFKGFADTISATPAGCGETWTTPGNSSSPPDTVPAYMAVVASSSIYQSGGVIEGNIDKLVVVITDPGYSPAPGHRGTGTVVGVLSCN